jgi:hypothetical protein
MRWIEKMSKSDVDRSAQTALADLAAFIALSRVSAKHRRKKPRAEVRGLVGLLWNFVQRGAKHKAPLA